MGTGKDKVESGTKLAKESLDHRGKGAEPRKGQLIEVELFLGGCFTKGKCNKLLNLNMDHPELKVTTSYVLF